MNHIEKLGKSKGISPKELYSGKWGDSVDEIIDRILNDNPKEQY